MRQGMKLMYWVRSWLRFFSCKYICRCWNEKSVVLFFFVALDSPNKKPKREEKNFGIEFHILAIDFILFALQFLLLKKNLTCSDFCTVEKLFRVPDSYWFLIRCLLGWTTVEYVSWVFEHHDVGWSVGHFEWKGYLTTRVFDQMVTYIFDWENIW